MIFWLVLRLEKKRKKWVFSCRENKLHLHKLLMFKEPTQTLYSVAQACRGRANSSLGARFGKHRSFLRGGSFFFCWLVLVNGFAQPFSRPADSLLLADERLSALFSWQNDTLLLFASAEQRQYGQPEFVLYPSEQAIWRQWLSTLPLDSLVARYVSKGANPMPSVPPVLSAKEVPSDSSRPLAGWRIALDPGHMAGDLAFAQGVEGKAIVMEASTQTNGQQIGFYESELTLATALLIRDSLEDLGAEVLLTRESPGVAAHGLDFATWKQVAFPDSLRQAVARGDMKPAQVSWWTSRASDAMIFRTYFNRSDLKARAEMIRAFQPDVTLMIHYNIDLPNWAVTQQGRAYLPGQENYCMAFVPGAFLFGELSEAEDRVMLLRMLLTDDVERSVELSAAFVRQSERLTGVPPVENDADLAYLTTSSLPAGEPGVFARNLTLTRLISGPVCYGESLCQDARSEVFRLNRREVKVGGRWVSSRVQEVASAYVAAVREFAGK